ncbi:MAG TPA: glycoside hydrolase domain-containing protein, partial [Bacteroidota bacterium]|nr:glycoside hydrolase domain-containing protein [Bacteroidota bacterium]
MRVLRSILLVAFAFSSPGAPARAADPWDSPASPGQLDAFVARFPAGRIIVVPESRDHPVRLLDGLPSAWLDRSDDSLAAFGAQARPGEYYVFQLCVYAAHDSLGNIRFTSEGLGGTGGRRIVGTAITCFNTGGTGYDGREFVKRLDIRKGRLQPLWIGIQVPPAARGSYNGVMTVSADNARSSEIRITMDVVDPASPGGAGEHAAPEATLSRLKWLNSTIAEDDRVTRGYTQIRHAGNSYRILGREVTIGEDGLPESISTFFTGSNQDLAARPSPVLQGPVRFQIETSNGSVAVLDPGGVKFTRSTQKTLEWESESTGLGGDLDLVCNAHAEFDGSVEYRCALTARRDMPVRDIRLELPVAMARYMMGLGRMGGLRPDRFEWTWDVLKKDQDMVWLGNVNGGIRLRLKAENYRRPLINVYYGFHPLNLPASWGNNGKGSIAITSVQGGGALLLARSGARILRTGEQLNFDFDLLVTPFHTMNRSIQFNDRYYHTYSDVSAGYLPEAVARGANIINIHHKSDINPFINYPYLESNVPYLRSFIDSAHGKGVRVKVYYTTRELTVNFPEFWALRSLNGEVIFPGPGNTSRTVIHPDGPPAWMIENLKEDYIPAWVCDFKEGRYRGVQDMAVITTPDSRWN